MDSWRVAVLGDGGVGKVFLPYSSSKPPLTTPSPHQTALAVQASEIPHHSRPSLTISPLVYTELFYWYVV